MSRRSQIEKAGRKSRGKNFIAGAIHHPGALHEDLSVPQGQPIPQGKLEAAEHMPGKVGQRARFAAMLKGLPHGAHHTAMHGASAKRKLRRHPSAKPAPAASGGGSPKFGSPEWDAKYHIQRFQKGARA